MRLLTASQISMLVPGANSVEVTELDHVFKNDPTIVNPPPLTPAQVTNLTTQQLISLTPAQLASFTALQAAALTPQQVAALSPAQYQGLLLALTGQGPGSGGTSGGTIATGAPAGATAAASSSANSRYPWASNGARIPIPLGVQTSLAVLNASVQRNYLLIQNNSTATAPDTAPNLLISLDGPVNTAQQQQFLNVPPGFGIIEDTRVLSNSLYVAWGSFLNGGGTAIVGAVLLAGYVIP